MRKKSFVTGVAVCLVFMLCSCAAVPAADIQPTTVNTPTPSVSANETPSAEQDASVIRIGALLPKSGTWEAQGNAAQITLEKALPYVNSYLDDYDLKIELDIRDTQSDPAKAQSELESLNDAGVKTVIGPMSSEESTNVLQYAADNEILLLSPSATASELSNDDSFFRMVATDACQIDGLTRIMNSVYKIQSVICVYIDDTYGRGFNNLMSQMSGDQNMTLAGSVAISSTDPNYANAAEQLSQLADDADSKTTAVVIVASSPIASELIKEAAQDEKLATMKWFASADIIGNKAILQDKQVASFLQTTGMEGLTIGYKDIALDALPYIGGLLAGAADESAYAIPTWDALWLLAYTYATGPDADFKTFKQNLMNCAGNCRNAFGSYSTMDENGDAQGARYMRYICADNNGSPAWLCKGHYVDLGTGEPIIKTIEWKTAPDAGETTVGVLLPLTGNHAENGLEIQCILQYAAERFNEYAQTIGTDLTLKLMVEDTQSDPAKAAEAAQKLIDSGITAMIGPIDSSELEAVKPLIDKAGIIDISPLTTAPSLSVKDRIYRLSLNDGVQTKALSALLAQDGIENVVVLNANDTYGNEFATILKDTFAGNVVLIPYDTTLSDYSDVLKQADEAVKNSDASKTAVVAISHNELAQILNAIGSDSTLKNVRWYGTDSTAYSNELMSAAAQTAAAVQYTVLDFSPYGQTFDPLYYVINSTLEPNIPFKESSLSAFDGLWLLGCAYLNDGTSADIDTLNTYVASNAFRGLGGVVKLDENGDRQFGYYKIYQVTEKQGTYSWQNIGVYSQDFVNPGVLNLFN